ncbi:MAG: cohesin domain-containing protein [Candidatus Bathyarchaeia archaeon]
MKRGRHEECSICVCLVLCLFSVMLPVSVLECSAQAGSATVAVSPPSITASVGQSFSVNVTVGNVSDPYGVYGWEFTLNWTASLLDSVDIIEGPFLKAGGTTFFTYNSGTQGHMIVDCTLEGAAPGVNGDGILATLTFYVKDVGQSSLHLYNATLVDGNSTNPTDIPCQVVGGYGYFTSPHDVAVKDVQVSPTAVPIGTLVGINVTVQDLGGFDENFNVTVYANSQVIGMQPVYLTIGSSANLAFTWNTSGFGKGDYKISASVSLAPGEVNTGNNTGIANTPVTILTPGHDIAVIGLILLKTVVGQGYNMSIGVFVKDYGVFSETFNVTAYANATLVGTQMVTLASAEEAELIFNSSTVNMTKGKYNVSASAGPVSGETDTSDNSRVDGLVTITIPGDLNGDRSVDIYDAIILANAFNSSSGNSNWNPNADINGDNAVDIYDAIIMAENFGKTNP